jgi:hypothetical protein
MDKNVRCRLCGERLDKECKADTVFQDWLRMEFYLEHQLSEGEITVETFNELSNALQSVKPYSIEGSTT